MSLTYDKNSFKSNKMDRFSGLSAGTPLIMISPNIYGKLETYNPTGSVKDRMISYVIRAAIDRGEIGPGTVLCEATSGNTGISLSAVAASLGLKCKIFMPENMSRERKKMMSTFGAEVTHSDPNDFIGAINLRDSFLNKNANAWSPMQFSNPDNIACHETVTAPEIQAGAKALDREWSAFVHGAGTGGTIEGIRRYLRKESAPTKVCLVRPSESPHGIQGIADGKDFLALPEDMDNTIDISTEEAIARAEKFTKDTGVLVGISSGANILASEIWEKNNNQPGVIITMLCDRGERYLSVYGKSDDMNELRD